jgi:hypothetical protein
MQEISLPRILEGKIICTDCTILVQGLSLSPLQRFDKHVSLDVYLPWLKKFWVAVPIK